MISSRTKQTQGRTGMGINESGFNPKKVGVLAAALVAVVMVLTLSGQVVETNNSGYYQVKQGAMDGALSVRATPGMYFQNFGTITTYKISDEFYFSKHATDGDEASEPVKVQFNDGGKAFISGTIKFRLSLVEKDALRLHEDFRSYQAVKSGLIRQIVTEAVQQTANLMKAEESYSTRRSEFAALAEEMVKQGIFETVPNVQKWKDADGNEFIETSVHLKMGPNNKPLVRKLSTLPRYNIEILQFVIKDIDFDETIDSLISKKKEAEQQKVVARANAERAKQDAITAREQGEAKIAVAKAEEEVKKIQAVVEAQKEYEVSKLSRQKAEQDAQSRILQGEAEAKVARQKVAAGLTPLERATIERDTAIGVADKLSQIQLPTTFIAGSGGKNGGGVDPFTAVGINQLLDITEKMSRPKRVRAKASTPATEEESE